MMKKSLIITGGAGFIGINAARYFLNKGWNVTILDNFSRKGADANLSMLEKDVGKVSVIKADVVKDFDVLKKAFEAVDVVLHLAAQVAVTTSIANPRDDFEINAIGSFNVIEAVRLSARRPILLYSSTNKVYGSLEHRAVVEADDRYEFKDEDVRVNGISERESLDFHSPYGCSKGIADQYIIDYSRIYGLKTVVFRQSCIYGPYQFGVEDQGWAAWFGIAALFRKPITIYGTGKQVRDLLYVTDLIRFYDVAISSIDRASGNAYNVGGGPSKTLSLRELLANLEKRFDRKIEISHSAIRTGDQPIFIADTRKAKEHFGWNPEVGVSQGLDSMMNWIEANHDLIKKILG